MASKDVGPRGFSEETVKEKTGKSSAEWYAVLDAWDRPSKGHTKMAKYLRENQGVSPWWAQEATNRYEHERGLWND